MDKIPAAVREIDSIIYDLFHKVSYRMWGNRKAKDEIREIQSRLGVLKNHLTGPYACGKELIREGVAIGMYCNQPSGHDGPC